MQAIELFDPVKYSLQENAFLLKHLGEPPVVALESIRSVPMPYPAQKEKNPVLYPDGVIPAAVRPIIERVYELQELEKHKGESWVGVEALKGKIRDYLRESEKWSSDKRRGRVRFPSMASYDAKGRPHMGAVGSDSGFVKTYFDANGNRIPFAIELQPSGLADWHPEWSQEGKVDETLVDKRLQIFVDADNRRMECKICGHTESYKPESRASYNAARARISKHLRTADLEVSLHRELHTNEFGG